MAKNVYYLHSGIAEVFKSRDLVKNMNIKNDYIQTIGILGRGFLLNTPLPESPKAIFVQNH